MQLGPESSANWQPNPVRVSAFGHCASISGLGNPGSFASRKTQPPKEAVAFNGLRFRGCGRVLRTTSCFLSNGHWSWQQMRICGMECIWAPLAGEQMKIYIKRRSVSGEGCCPLIFHGFPRLSTWVSLFGWRVPKKMAHDSPKKIAHSLER